jgi:hypothetical protein
VQGQINLRDAVARRIGSVPAPPHTAVIWSFRRQLARRNPNPRLLERRHLEENQTIRTQDSVGDDDRIVALQYRAGLRIGLDRDDHPTQLPGFLSE